MHFLHVQSDKGQIQHEEWVAIGKKYGFESICYGHAGDGNLHVNIIKGNQTRSYSIANSSNHKNQFSMGCNVPHPPTSAASHTPNVYP